MTQDVVSAENGGLMLRGSPRVDGRVVAEVILGEKPGKTTLRRKILAGRERVAAAVSRSAMPIGMDALEPRRLFAATPYAGLPIEILLGSSAVIEAEHYDLGGQGVGYNDSDGLNLARVFRPRDRVDLAVAADATGGFALTQIQPGEWTAYTVDIAEHGEWDISLRVRSSVPAGQLAGYAHLESGAVGVVGGEGVGMFVINGTNGAWQDVTLRGVHLHEGLKWLRLVQDFGADAYEVDQIRFTPSTDVHLGSAVDAQDHHDLEGLVSLSAVSHTAVRSGAWSDSATWAFGAVPTAGANVWVPQGTTVAYDVNASVALRTIRLDGTLRFATSVSTRLVVDTVVVLRTGAWEQGTATLPVADGVTSTVTFADDGPINREWDPRVLSRGLIVHGSASIFGSAKSSFHSLNGVNAGVTTLTLDAAPSNWKVGDVIVLTGTYMTDLTYGKFAFHDEKRTITAISGSVVTLDTPLQYKHQPPAGSGFKIYVANYTRNITFNSANTDYSSNDQIQRHGHVMFMHTSNVAVAYAAFNDLGRTNKGQIVNDPTGVREEGDGQYDEGTGQNSRGRYSLHFHRTGFDPNSAPAVVKGNAVMGSPGWGYVNHQAYVIFEDNAAYDVDGAAFVEETGDGIGAFRRNIAIGMKGENPQGEWRANPKLGDLGHAGHGFFFRGNATEAENNVVASAGDYAYAWNNKHGQPPPRGAEPVPSAAVAHAPAAGNNTDRMGWGDVPTTVFRGNTAFASGSGLAAHNWMDFAANGIRHEVRQEVTDMTIWNVYRNGIDNNYSSQVTFRNIRVINDPLYHRGYQGINASSQSLGNIWDDVVVSGFQVGFNASGGHGTRGMTVFSDTSTLSIGNTVATSDNEGLVTWAIKAGRDLTTLSFALDPVTPVVVFWSTWGNSSIRLRGSITDSLGTRKVNSRSAGGEDSMVTEETGLRDLLRKGYYTRPSTGQPYLVLQFAYSNRITNALKFGYREVDFNLNQVPADWRIGPNLGEFVSVLGTPVRQINAGGAATGAFGADQGPTGGVAIAVPDASRDTSVWGTAPAAAYGTERRSSAGGSFAYAMSGLEPGKRYTLRLHFSESEVSAVQQRLFDVEVNGVKALAGFDVFAVAGAKNKAVVRELPATADASGTVNVSFTAKASPHPFAFVNAIELLAGLQDQVVAAPLFSEAAGSFTAQMTLYVGSKTKGATVHYTTDGSIPTTSSPVFSGAIVLAATTTVRAIAVVPGMTSSTVSSSTYTFTSTSAPHLISIADGIPGWARDTYLRGGFVSQRPSTQAIDISAVGSGPADLYRTRYEQPYFGEFNAVIPRLETGDLYTVRLHFSEFYLIEKRQRRFDVHVNGTIALADFDVFAAAGGQHKAVVRDVLNVQPGLNGQIRLDFKNRSGTAFINGIEIIRTGRAPMPTAVVSAPQQAVAGTPISLTAIVKAQPSDVVVSVEFFDNGTPIGTATPSGTGVFTRSWTPSSGGNRLITARVHTHRCVCCGTEANSAAVSVVGTPSAPARTSTNVNGVSSVSVQWTDGSDNETGFIVERSRSPVFATEVVASPLLRANSTTYVATGLRGGEQYYFRVRAVGQAGVSSTSAVAGARVSVLRTDGELKSFREADRRLFAVDSLARDSFSSLLVEADANGDKIVTSAEAKAQVGRIKSAMAVAKTDQAAAIRNARSNFSSTFGELRSQLREELSGGSGLKDRAVARQAFNSGMADTRSTLKEELSLAASTFKGVTTTLRSAQTVFNVLSSALTKPFAADTDNNGALTLSNGEVARLASRDGNTATLTARDLAGINKIPRVR